MSGVYPKTHHLQQLLKLPKIRQAAAAHYQAQQQYLAQAQMAQQAAMQQAMYNGYTNTIASASTTSTTGLTWVTVPTGTVTTAMPTSLGNNMMNQVYSSQHLAAMDNALLRETLRLMGDITIADGEPCKITLPDGGVLEVDADGSYRINDKDAKVIYRANRVRDFNPFVNASDKLEGFIKFCGALGVRQEEMLNIPIKHFIAWLIVEAAAADGEDTDHGIDQERLAIELRPKDRCRCGRFLPRRLISRKIAFCRPVCLERELEAA